MSKVTICIIVHAHIVFKDFILQSTKLIDVISLYYCNGRAAIGNDWENHRLVNQELVICSENRVPLQQTAQKHLHMLMDRVNMGCAHKTPIKVEPEIPVVHKPGNLLII